MDTKSVEIKCTKCGKWFESPIFFGDIESFDISTLENINVQCPHCSKVSPGNKENMRVRSTKGGFIGKDT